MSNLYLEKIIIIGWSNFTASIAEGIKKQYPNCEIFCPDAQTPMIDEAYKYGYLNSLPFQTRDIYEDAQFVIIDQSTQEILDTIQRIQPFLSPNTYIIDFTPIKTHLYEKISSILDAHLHYVSCFVFLDTIPTEITIRSNIFQDKIVAIISEGSTEILQEMRDFWNIFQAKIVPTSAEFFDEIVAETSQSISLLAHMFTNILLQDSWADTLFFGFYNKDLRSFLNTASLKHQYSSESIIENAENIRRSLSFLKREIEKIDELIDNEEYYKLTQYMESSYNFKKRI